MKRQNIKKNFNIFTNLAISFDGKISTYKKEHIIASKHDRLLMDYHRSRAHAVLIGAGTLRAFKEPAAIERPRFRLLRKIQGLSPHPLNIVLTSRADFDPNWPFFKDPGIQRLIIAPRSIPETSLKPFEGLARIYRYEEREDYPEQIIGHLKTLGCRNLLIEGGGGILFPWVERDLIDEWNVTLVPKVIGGETAPTMVEGKGFDAKNIRSFQLKKCKKKGSELFLQYRR